MDFPSWLNLRDLGGLPTRDKRAVSSARFYRAGDLSRLEPAAVRALATLRLRGVIDLRSSRELEQLGSGPRLESCRRLHIPLFEDVRSNWVAPSDQSPGATAARYLEMLADGTGALVRIVKGLSEPSSAPFVVHCAAGRDRTGIVVACLLDLLDVEDEAIAADYAISDAVVHDGGRALAETIHEFLALLRQWHGSSRELVLAFGATEAELARFSQELVSGGGQGSA